MHETSLTLETDREALAFMLGVELAKKLRDARIDPEETNTVLIDVPMKYLDVYVEKTRKFKADAAVCD
jgi:hypothetical protein